MSDLRDFAQDIYTLTSPTMGKIQEKLLSYAGHHSSTPSPTKRSQLRKKRKKHKRN